MLSIYPPTFSLCRQTSNIRTKTQYSRHTNVLGNAFNFVGMKITFFTDTKQSLQVPESQFLQPATERSLGGSGRGNNRVIPDTEGVYETVMHALRRPDG